MTNNSDFFVNQNLALHSSLTTSRPNSNNDFRTRRPNQRPFQSFPKGVCWRFHSRQFCRGCNFKHSCFKCGSVHPATQCTATRSNTNNRPAPNLPSRSDRASAEPRANRKSVTLKELQSLIGLLNFACCVVVPGRAFLRRLIDLTRGVRKPTHHVRLTRKVNMIYKFGSIFCDRITANPSSSAHAGTLPKPSNYLRTRRVLLVMPRFLESSGFSGNGLPFGKHLTSLS